MQIIGYKYRKLNYYLLLLLGLSILVYGITKLFKSSFDFRDYHMISGTISKIDFLDMKDYYNSKYKGLLVQIKNLPDRICFNNTQLLDKIQIGDSIKVYMNGPSKSINNFNVFGVYVQNKVLIDLNDTVRFNKWIGLISVSIGLLLMIIFFSNFNEKTTKYERIDIDNLPY